MTFAGTSSLRSAMIIATKTDANETKHHKRRPTTGASSKKAGLNRAEPQWIEGCNVLGKIHIGNARHRFALLRKAFDKLTLKIYRQELN